MMSILNVRVITTAAESPFLNGFGEQVHAVTGRVLLKQKEENEKTGRQTLLSWANMAKTPYKCGMVLAAISYFLERIQVCQVS